MLRDLKGFPMSAGFAACPQASIRPYPVTVSTDHLAFRDLREQAFRPIGGRHQGDLCSLVAEVIEVHNVVRKPPSTIGARPVLGLLDQLSMALNPSPTTASYLGQVSSAV